MFELPPVLWVGQIMEIATMTSSVVTAVEVETDRSAITSVGGDSASAHNTWIQPAASREHAAAWAPRPAGMPEQPCAVPGLSRGTRPEGSAVASRGIAHNVVVGQSAALPRAASPSEPEVPYPRRHVMYAENAAAFLRSISRRDRLFDDLSGERELKARLYKALDDCAELLEQIRRRGRR